MQAKKSLGQNFLSSKAIVSRIAGYGDVKKGELVIEIGPGKGILTAALLEKEADVTVIEKDDRLIPLLTEKFKEFPQFNIIHADVLETEIEKIVGERKYKVIANIPYYITGEILRRFLEAKHKPETMVILVQKEVAERIATRDGKESILSLSVKAFGEPKVCEKVKKEMFSPVPKVDSSVLKIDNISGSNFKDKIEREKFFTLVKAGFLHKRKVLIKNLSDSGFEREKILETLHSFGKNEKARAEELPLSFWLRLLEKI